MSRKKRSTGQQSLLPPDAAQLALDRFPLTRYQGSKRKLLPFLWQHLQDLPFNTVLDVFGGTGAVSYLFKCAGKQVIYNDHLHFNRLTAQALIENNDIHLSEGEIAAALSDHSEAIYPTLIQTVFQGLYFTDAENAWLDRVTYNIRMQLQGTQQAIAFYALCQACLAKRPYNLFHRANLYMREAEVTRTFGNKTTWDKPFETHFRNFVAEANHAVFDNGQEHSVLQLDAGLTPTGADLVYLDPPYLNAQGVSVDYHGFYHFLEGLCLYDSWQSQIDYTTRHRRLQPMPSAWLKADQILSALEQLIMRHKQSIVAISYRDNGIPDAAILRELLGGYKRDVQVVRYAQQYALSNTQSHELLFIAR